MHIHSKKTHYINGTWALGTGDTFFSLNPSTQRVLWQTKQATANEIAYAVHSAEHAAIEWKKYSFEERAAYIKHFMNIVGQRKESLAEAISLETGKPFWESRTEIQAVISKIDISINIYQKRTLETHPQTDSVRQSLRYKPLGLMAVLGAYNFPAHLSNGHIIPALLSGNTIIYKPSELTPYVATCIAECWDEAQLPKGVFNLIQGGKETAERLLTHTEINGVAFTGSYRTGLAIAKQLVNRPEVLLALEMGGNNPLIIDDSVKIPAAIYGIIVSAYLTAGQRCSCARRLIIPNNAFGDQLIKELQFALKKIQIGPPSTTADPFMGPVIRHEHALQHQAWVTEWIRRGAVPLNDMMLIDAKGSFLTPGLLDMSTVSLVPDIECFAPLLQVYRYDHFEQAIAIANHTKYGLSAGLFSADKAQYDYFYDHINAGIICWNRPTTGSPSTLPFGGLGHSGNHRPSGAFAIDYCQDPITILEEDSLQLPSTLMPGLML